MLTDLKSATEIGASLVAGAPLGMPRDLFEYMQ